MPLWQEKQRFGAASWSWNLVSDACGLWQVVQPSAIGRCWWRAAAPCGALCGPNDPGRELPQLMVITWRPGNDYREQRSNILPGL